jgi:pimeloyl-ACP methyl ester carboxylesterase
MWTRNKRIFGRTVCRGIAGKVCLAGLFGWVATLFLCIPPAYADAFDGWSGAGVMAGGKGYAPTPMGQVHFRDLGPRETKYPVLMLHQAWMSMIEFAEIQNEMAKLGYRSIALDTPGHGMSDPAPEQPTIGDLAENIIPVLDYLKISRVIVVGHHTGALIGAAFAAHHPDRAQAVVLHGVPYFTAEESAMFAARPGYDRTPRDDGSHMSKWFSYRSPSLPPDSPESLRSRTWMLLEMFMMGPDIGHYAVYHYDMTADAKAISAPTLILSDKGDLVHDSDLRLLRLRPDFAYKTFTDESGNAMMNHPQQWAAIVGAYLEPLEK